MDNNSRTDHDHAVAGVAMEISYRLTAAVNIVRFKLESKEWFVNWHGAIRVALTEFISLTEPDRLGGQRKHASDHRLMRSVELLSGDISTWTATAGDDDGPSVVRAMLEPLVEARKLLCRMLAVEADNKSDPGNINIIDFWLLGEKLATDDLKSFAPYVNNPPCSFGKSPEYFALGIESYRELTSVFPWGEHKDIEVFVNKYMERHKRSKSTGQSFTSGAGVNILQTLLYSGHYPAVVWAMPDSE